MVHPPKINNVQRCRPELLSEVIDPKLPPVPRLDLSADLDDLTRSRLELVLSKVKPPSLDLDVIQRPKVEAPADVEVRW